VVIATATAVVEDQGIGDVSIILPEGLAKSLESSVETAITSCGSVVKKKVRREDIELPHVRRQIDEGRY